MIAPTTTGPFCHGTRADLKAGDPIGPGYAPNDGQRKPAAFVDFAAKLEAAIWGAEFALGDQPGRIDSVEPTDPFEDDPNLTDKKFPGNPTLSHRTRDPLRVTAEVIGWLGHPPEQFKTMQDSVADLARRGIEAIED